MNRKPNEMPGIALSRGGGLERPVAEITTEEVP